MTSDIMSSGAVVKFFINVLIGVVSIAIVGFLTFVFGEALKYILGLAGIACLLYVIFTGGNSGNGIDYFSGPDE